MGSGTEVIEEFPRAVELVSRIRDMQGKLAELLCRWDRPNGLVGERHHNGLIIDTPQ
jgi:hypothetical protein